MILIQDKRIKVGGIYLPGIIKSTKVSESGKLEDKKKGKKTLSNQPAGYEAATVEYEIYFEENGVYTLPNMIRAVQRQFKKSGQTKQAKVKLVDSYVNARGISEVYFNEFVTSGEESQSWVTGTLTFVAPVINGLKVAVTKQTAAKAAAEKRAAASKAAAEKRKKTTKQTKESPAGKKRNMAAARAAAKKLVEK